MSSKTFDFRPKHMVKVQNECGWLDGAAGSARGKTDVTCDVGTIYCCCLSRIDSTAFALAV